MDVGSWIELWWDTYNPYTTTPSDVKSGGRQVLPTSGYVKYPGGVTHKITDGNRQLGPCQYWINGLPKVCQYWDSDALSCTYEYSDPLDRPTGYGVEGACDMLGRRKWCTKYIADRGGDVSDFACVLPCVERSGLGKQIKSEDGTLGFKLSYRPLLPDEIQGYNADEDGVGRCDGLGMGRGDQGPFDNVEDAFMVYPRCRFYRPMQMGFGAYQPRPYHGDEKPGLPFAADRVYVPQTTAGIHDRSKADPLTAMDPRLPFIFQVYNHRATFQKCAHWRSLRPAIFSISTWGDNIGDFSIELDEDPIGLCECDMDSMCGPYRTVDFEWVEGVPPMLQFVWAEYGGIVCNGAKPECPCYTGKWVYCTDANMQNGMRISANQIMELRFWESSWESQSEYEEYYQRKPGPTRNEYADETTAYIHTFNKWKKLDPDDPSQSQMLGYKIGLCQPAPLQGKMFDPEKYLTKELIEYPVLNQFMGSNVQGEVSFPTLLRELDDIEFPIPDINLIYPYSAENPWDIEPCSQDEDIGTCKHDFNTIASDPVISFIGCAVLDSEVFIVNSNLVATMGSAKIFMDEYSRANQINVFDWELYCKAMDDMIAACDKENKGLFKGTTDQYGFFHVNDVELELNKLNNLYVVCKYNDFTYTGNSSASYVFKRVTVESRFWGAMITQSDMTHTHSGDSWEDTVPQYFDEPFRVEGRVSHTMGEVDSIISAYSLFEYSPIGDNHAYYSYFINEYTVVVEELDKWVQVGATGYIWAEIDDVEISYLWDFEVTSAAMTYANPDDNLSINLCGAEETVSLEVVYPDSDETQRAVDRKTIPPNAVLLKYERPLSFFNDDWTLTIEYKYRRFETSKVPDTAENAETVFPTGLDLPLSQNRSASSPFEVTQAGSSFSVERVGDVRTRGTIKVMAFIVDDNMRIQTAAASKLLLQLANVGCRSVDIYYKYAGDAIAYDLQPSTGFFTWRGAPSISEASSEGLKHGNTPSCGDHECGDPCVGPMWFPFNRCRTEAFYNVLNGAAYCTMKISEGDEQVELMGSGAYRYMMPEEHRAWVTPGGNFASACGTSFYYHYSIMDLSSVKFTGRAYKKGIVDKWRYALSGWEMPPFGNTGRGHVERFVSRDFYTFVDTSEPTPSTAAEYVPLVFDAEDLVYDLNCFAREDQYAPTADPFFCFSMMNLYLANFLEEGVQPERRRFDEIIEVVYHGNSMYPPPISETAGGTSVQRYAFKEENIVWAWPEYWKPIERDFNAEGEFKFVTLLRPEYYLDNNKEEHRLITEEGLHSIIFEPPVSSEGLDGEGDTEGSSYASISIDGAYPRFFEIIYDDYDEDTIDWVDESTSGEVGSSGGSEDGNIYEVANNNPAETSVRWVHDADTVFDNEASQDPSDDRKVFLYRSSVTGEYVYGYYNCGLIAKIYRNRLQYLPVELSDAGDPTDSYTEDGRYIGYWEIGTFGVAPLEVTVKGKWGIEGSGENEIIYSYPGIAVRESAEEPEEDPATGLPSSTSGYSVARTVYNIGTNNDDILSSFSTTLELPRQPRRLANTLLYFTVELSAAAGELLNITSVDVKLGRYVRSEENIYVWERKYYVGAANNFPSGALNADGPDSNLFRTYDRQNRNGGQYFPFIDDISTIAPPAEAAGKVISKSTMVGFGEIVREDEEIDLTVDSLKYEEETAQSRLYEAAYDRDDLDELHYTGRMPPMFDTWLSEKGTHIEPPTSLSLRYEKIDWEHHSLSNQLQQDGTFWNPGGHYFAWSSSTFSTRCYIFGPVQDVYSVEWIHYLHGGATSTMDGGTSYAGWGRYAYYNGRINNIGVDDGYEYATTDSLTGAKNGVFTQVT